MIVSNRELFQKVSFLALESVFLADPHQQSRDQGLAHVKDSTDREAWLSDLKHPGREVLVS